MSKILKPVSLAVGAAFLGSLAFSASAATSNGFSATDLAQGYMLVGEDKPAEGKCGADKAKEEGKCGEGKCGADKAKEEGKCGEGKCGADKAKADEEKKGEEGKCGADKKGEEGKCGAA